MGVVYGRAAEIANINTALLNVFAAMQCCSCGCSVNLELYARASETF